MITLREILGRTLHQSWLMVALSIGVVIGVVMALVLRINYFASPVWVGMAMILLVFAYLRPEFAFVVVGGLAGVVLAFFRVAVELTGADYVRGLYGQVVTLEGVVSGDPVEDEKGVKVKLADLKFGENGEYSAAGSVYVTGRKGVELKRSDKVVLNGKMEEGFGTYAGYMYQPEVVKVMRPEPGDLILGVRDFFAERIRGLIPEPEANLGLSYLLGMKAGLSDNLSEQLRVVGLTHIVVASGAHLSILVEIARKIFGRISRFSGVMFSAMFVLFFMAMVGWTPSIMRAGIMALFALVAGFSGRKILPIRMILMVAAVTLMINPMFVIDLGWLLSFASFIGIMVVGPGLSRFFYGKREPGFVGGTVLTTVAATVMTLPVVLYFYGQVSLISVVANLLILPTLPVAMGAVFVTGVVAGVPGVEVMAGWVAKMLLDFHIGVVGFFGEMTQFLVKIPPYQPGVFLLYVVIIVGLLVGKMIKLRQVKLSE